MGARAGAGEGRICPGSGEAARASALWTRRKRTGLAVALALTVPSLAAGNAHAAAYVSPDLLAQAKAHPADAFDVIVESAGGATSDAAQAVQASQRRGYRTGQLTGISDRFRVIPGVAAHLSGLQITLLAAMAEVRSITADAPMQATALPAGVQQAIQMQSVWPRTVQTAPNGESGSGGATPTIAIIDSGIDRSRSDFSGRVLAAPTLTALPGNSPGDGEGHGTFVASIAAGAANGHVGAAPSANLVSLDVMDDNGMAMTSDVIAACDWIYAHRGDYNIEVANLSLTGTVESSFMFDPLDKAVEKLWLAGVTVVTAAGNYGTGATPSGVSFAPGNDPFVITVGATDTMGTSSPADDVAAPWSAYGSTPDGFAKPEVGAPGRYLVGAVPPRATFPTLHPERVTDYGYMWMSGTSFAAPIVSGIAARLLAAHPTWTPDQVKGALMLKAEPGADAGFTYGVGTVRFQDSAGLSTPPNPNAALYDYVTRDPAGGPTPVFDSASWRSAATANASWSSASWRSASWTSASWSSASWTSASWASASWRSASWTSASWSATAPNAASWTSSSWAE